MDDTTQLRRPLRFLPGFRASCFIVCGTYVLITANLFTQGLMKAMKGFGVPTIQLESPHYFNAIVWVYLEMLVIGVLIGAIGLLVREPVAQLWLSRVIFASHLSFTVLDAQTSESIVGNALYKTSASIIPALIGLTVTLLFLHLSFAKIVNMKH